MKHDVKHEPISDGPPGMKNPLTSKSFLLWQPMLLVSAYLTTSILHVLITPLISRISMREAIDDVLLLLILVIPCALALASITYLMIRNDLCEKRRLLACFWWCRLEQPCSFNCYCSFL
ncbi:MAG: hypothetical protein JWR26_3791 [Pedosphaera sp.]|nr:hypothetical protein [Pedosphaera sp.]